MSPQVGNKAEHRQPASPCLLVTLTSCVQKAEPEGVEPQRAQYAMTDKVKPAGPCGPAEDLNPDHEPLVVLSSAESSEDEDGDGSGHSILPSSVLDRARDIALHGSARRGGVASEGRVKPGGVASNGVLPQLPSCADPANRTPRLRRSSSVSAPPWSPLSLLDDQSEQIGRGFTLTEQDQLLIGRIKAYYENAANQDETFTLRRRRSLTFIPDGLVRDSVSRFTRNPQEPPEEPCTEPGLDENLESSSEQVSSTSSDIMKIWKEMETRKNACTVPQNQNHQDRARDRTRDKTTDRTTDRTFSQMVKNSWSSQEEPEVLLPAVLSDADVGGAQRTVLSLARRFSQQIRTSSSENHQSVSSVQEVTLQLPQLSPTHARGHAASSVEAFEWPDVRELRSRYDECRTRGLMQETNDQRPSSELAPPQMLHRPCVSVAPDLSTTQGRVLQENFVGFRVAAEAPLLTDSKHRILVLEKVPELSEDPRGAGGEDSYIQIRSPTSREKISLKAVMERCRVYEDSEENRLRKQSMVRNLREKFQSLS
uniref:Uncharacterized protein n=1 Tax=Gouania willdenowi TaxID=441366 RepID=A0A8C5GXU9_GOUWI